eukprot:Rhum_TRINITY_DN13114_c3_g1::Rhum_TRINITY_DN13114_c3_g1_i1::g.57238::m.57238
MHRKLSSTASSTNDAAAAAAARRRPPPPSSTQSTAKSSTRSRGQQKAASGRADTTAMGRYISSLVKVRSLVTEREIHHLGRHKRKKDSPESAFLCKLLILVCKAAGLVDASEAKPWAAASDLCQRRPGGVLSLVLSADPDTPLPFTYTSASDLLPPPPAALPRDHPARALYSWLVCYCEYRRQHAAAVAAAGSGDAPAAAASATVPAAAAATATPPESTASESRVSSHHRQQQPQAAASVAETLSPPESPASPASPQAAGSGVPASSPRRDREFVHALLRSLQLEEYSNLFSHMSLLAFYRLTPEQLGLMGLPEAAQRTLYGSIDQIRQIADSQVVNSPGRAASPGIASLT